MSSSVLPPVPTFQSRVSQSQVPPVVAMDETMLGERVQLFYEFLDSQKCTTDGLEYREKVRGIVRRGDGRLIVNVNDVRHFNEDYAKGLMFEPMHYLSAFDAALSNMVQLQGESNAGLEGAAAATANLKVQYHVGLEGSFGEMQVTPRSLSTRHLSKIISIEGIITTCLLVRPKLTKSVHYVEKKGIFMMREYKDATTSPDYVPTSGGATYPTEDSEGNALVTEYGYCGYRDHQKVILQEMPERAPPGQLPRSLDVLLVDDLVDRVKPGDRVQIVGVYKAIASVTNGGQVPPHFKTVILANRVRHLGKESQLPMLTDVDIQNIKKIAKREDVFDLMGRSIAPSICGHGQIKKALLLMLLGGVEKNLENTHLRGDINILMVGDPSTAKSQLLRFLLHVAPLAIATTGRGSSGVGLTAAVLMDKETGERRLEAGAMVLADRGIVCIDEFDKMSEMDRVAIHEVMEQQTVTIAKAGIHLSLNARCSVVAAANPIYAQYRDTLTPQENIRLPDSLLSRFDLLFIVLDTMNERTDRAISQHVTSMHRYLAPGQEEGTRASEQLLLDQDENTNNIEGSVFEKTNRHLYRHLLRDDEVSDEEEEGLTNEELALIQAQKEEYLSIGFLKKFLHYAKVRVKPILTIEASEAIRRAYHVFRGRKDQETNGFSGSGGNTVHLERTLPVTPRTLETLIRLATAHAKLRLSHVIEDEDVQVAESMLRFCLYKEVVKIKKNKKAKKAKNEEKSKDEKVTGTPAGQVKDFENLSLQDVVEKDVFEFPKDTKKKRGARAIFNDDDDDEGLSVAVSDALSSDEGNLSDATIRAAVEDEFLEDEVLANFTTIGNETTTDVVLSEECKAWIRSALNRLQVTATASGDFLPISTLMQDLERSHTIPPTIDQVEIVLKNLSDEGLIYLSPEGDIVFL